MSSAAMVSCWEETSGSLSVAVAGVDVAGAGEVGLRGRGGRRGADLTAVGGIGRRWGPG